MRAVRAHSNETDITPLFRQLYWLRLPAEYEHMLANLRVWDPDTVIDLAAESGAARPTGGRQRDVCVVSFAAAVRLQSMFRGRQARQTTLTNFKLR